MSTVYDSTTIGLDIAKNVFYYSRVNHNMKRQSGGKLKRSEVQRYFAGLDPKQIRCVALEACSNAHYWGRMLQEMGLTVMLLPPRWVKPYVVNNKTDANDSLAIAEASFRPSIHAVAVKSVAQQDLLMLHRLRSQLVKNRTQQRNALRSHLSERGLVTRKGKAALYGLIETVLAADAEQRHKWRLSDTFVSVLDQAYIRLIQTEAYVTHYDERIMTISDEMESVQRLQTIPGVGYLTASALVAAIGDGREFTNGRQLSAWLGLVPAQHSSGGKHKSLGISKRGDRYLRTLLNHAARAVLRSAQRDEKQTDVVRCKARRVAERRGQGKAIAAVANQLARISWAVLSKGVSYRASAAGTQTG